MDNWIYLVGLAIHMDYTIETKLRMVCNAKSLITKFEFNQIEHENTPSYACSQKFSNVVSRPSIECHVLSKLTFKWLRHIFTIYVGFSNEHKVSYFFFGEQKLIMLYTSSKSFQ
jgi:hypothetical protein